MKQRTQIDRAAGYSHYTDAKLLLANFAGQVNTMLHSDDMRTAEYVEAWRECMEMMLRRKLTEKELAEAVA